MLYLKIKPLIKLIVTCLTAWGLYTITQFIYKLL